MTDRPLLLLDIDGVLNPFAAVGRPGSAAHPGVAMCHCYPSNVRNGALLTFRRGTGGALAKHLSHRWHRRLAAGRTGHFGRSGMSHQLRPGRSNRLIRMEGIPTTAASLKVL
jgi:hypothetical protein